MDENNQPEDETTEGHGARFNGADPSKDTEDDTEGHGCRPRY